MKTKLSTILLPVFLLLNMVAASLKADITYALVNHASDQSGHSLSGLITTTDASINDGYLVANEVVSWEFVIGGPNPTSVLSSNSGASLQLNGDVRISASSITIEQPSIMSELTNGVELLHNNGSRVLWERSELFGSFAETYLGQSPTGSAWSTSSPVMSGTDPWLVAVRLNNDSVPEPAGWALVAFMIAGVLSRRRRQGRRAGR